MGVIASQTISFTIVTQPFIQTQIKENIKALRHWPLCGNSPGTGEFPVQMASYTENVSIWWCHHVYASRMFATAATGRYVTSWHGNAFRITGPLWGESTGDQCDSPHKGPVMWTLMFSALSTSASCRTRSCGSETPWHSCGVVVMDSGKMNWWKSYLNTDVWKTLLLCFYWFTLCYVHVPGEHIKPCYINDVICTADPIPS